MQYKIEDSTRKGILRRVFPRLKWSMARVYKRESPIANAFRWALFRDLMASISVAPQVDINVGLNIRSTEL